MNENDDAVNDKTLTIIAFIICYVWVSITLKLMLMLVDTIVLLQAECDRRRSDRAVRRDGAATGRERRAHRLERRRAAAIAVCIKTAVITPTKLRTMSSLPHSAARCRGDSRCSSSTGTLTSV